jgi:hypothetical protein
VTTLREHDRSLQARLTPAEKLALALDMMAEGLALQRANLARRHPEATPEQLEALYRKWLFADE